MRDASTRVLRHTSDALYTDAATGRQVATETRFYSDGDHAWCVLTRDDGTLIDFEMPYKEFVIFSAFLFPAPPPTGTHITPPAPINIDGSPRNTLIDRWHHHRRVEPEATAAD